MNPFDLRGPEFLLFYILLSGVVLAVLASVRRAREAGAPPMIDLSDPYLIAYLRGGAKEASALAMATLIDRGLLRVLGTTVSADKSVGMDMVRRPIERDILGSFFAQGEPRETLRDAEALFSAACEPYQQHLEQLGVLPNADLRQHRLYLFLGAAAALVAVSGTKILIALSRGRTNVEFLIILTVLAVVLARRIANPFRTRLGDQLFANLGSLYGSLKDRAESIQPGGATNELAWLGAVFGLAAIPLTLFPHRDLLRSARAAAGGQSGDGSFWSSCASSCGGGCGGGGCGGGCGGCGGD